MSSLNGIAQFTNRFAQNIMGYEDNKKKEAERVADKERELARQAQQDKNAQETHDLGYQSDVIKLDETKDARTDSVNARNYGKTYNKVEYFKKMGDESGAIDAIVEGANSHSDLPYKINVDRDVNGKVASRTDENGNKYYFQNIIDKETGKIMRTDSVTYDQLMDGYTQLQSGQSIAAEKAAYEAERRKADEKDARERTIYGYKAKVDDAKDASKSQRDYDYKLGELGIRHDNAVDLAGVNHGYRSDEIDQRTANDINKTYATAGINQGQTPSISMGGNGASGITKVVGAGAGYTQYQLADGRVVTAKGNRNFRNNNLGNIEYGPFAKKMGAVGSDGRFAVFPDRETGIKAMEGLIFNSNSYKGLTLTDAINRYAPPSENQTSRYQASVLQAVGGQNKPMGQYTARERQAILQAMVAVEGKDNTTFTGGNGVKVNFQQPIQAKATKSSKAKQADAGSIATTKDYNANIDKGVNTAIKGAKQLGVKSDAATTATFARAGTKLKEMGKARSEQEFLGLYQEAFDLVLDAVPERSRSKMSKADQNALGHKVLLSMVGASSLGNLKDIVYRINPAAKNGGSVTAGGLTLPGQQARAPAPTKQTPQTGKLKALYSRGLPAPQTDPNAAETLNYLENLNDNMDW